MEDKPSLSVNVEGARRAHEERYRMERQEQYAKDLARTGLALEKVDLEFDPSEGLTPDEFREKYCLDDTDMTLEEFDERMARSVERVLVRVTERLNIPLPCGCLHPIDKLDHYEEEGWREEATCEHGTWVVERKGGIRVGERDRASRWASSGPLSDRS